MKKSEVIALNPDGQILYLDTNNPYSKKTTSDEKTNDHIKIYINNLPQFIENATYMLGYELEKKSRFIKCICIIDLILSILNFSLQYPYGVFVSFIALCGYRGAETYNKKQILVYTVYEYVKILIKFAFMFFIIQNNYIIILFFSACFDVYILTQLRQFYYLIPNE